MEPKFPHAIKVKDRLYFVVAIAQHLSSTQGYAWATNAQLVVDIGAKHDSTVERAISIADDELGLIIRKTAPQKNEAGKVIGRHRRIFAARPLGMAEALAAASRTPKIAKIAMIEQRLRRNSGFGKAVPNR